jgi:hypothetical protein
MTQQTDPIRSTRTEAPAAVLERKERNRTRKPFTTAWSKHDIKQQAKLWELLLGVRAIRPRAFAEFDRARQMIVIVDWDTEEVLGEAGLRESRWMEIPAWRKALERLEEISSV